MNDVAPEILALIEKEFNDAFNSSEKIKALRILLESNQATYSDANEFALEVGDLLVRAFKNNLSPSVLPDGRMYFNIAERILTPTLNRNYDLVIGFTKSVQDELNRQVGIGLSTVVPTLNQDKVKGIIDRVSSETNFEDISWILESPIIDFSQNAINDLLKANAEFQSNAGLSPTIKRTLVGGACEWCVKLAGSYSYPDVPKEVYQRHGNCRCTVEYIPGNVRKQNVWSKNWS